MMVMRSHYVPLFPQATTALFVHLMSSPFQGSGKEIFSSHLALFKLPRLAALVELLPGHPSPCQLWPGAPALQHLSCLMGHQLLRDNDDSEIQLFPFNKSPLQGNVLKC